MFASKQTSMTSFYSQKIPVGNCRIFKSSPLRKLTVMKMSDTASLATSYAAALLDLSKGKKVVEEVHTDMDTLSSVLKNDEALKEFLINPVISEDKKYKVLDKIAGEAGFNPYTTNFLKLLVQKGRMAAIQEIFEAFELEYCILTDTQIATLRSAVQLGGDQQLSVAQKIKDLTGAKNIRLKPIIDESLIGGFIVEYGSSQIDLSVNGQLDRISGQLNELASSGVLA